MKKYFIFMVAVLLLCVACEPSKTEEPVQQGTTYAQQLFLAQNPYVGDASANAKLLQLLTIDEELGAYTMELKTDEVPYIMKLNFEAVVSDREKFDSHLMDKAFLILALIYNVDEVQFAYPYIDNGQETLITYYFTEKQATEYLGKDIKSYGESEASVQELLNGLEK